VQTCALPIFLAARPAGLQLRAQELDVDARALEEVADHLVRFLDEAEEQVLGTDHLAPHLARLVASEEEDLLGLLGVLLEHGAREPTSPLVVSLIFSGEPNSFRPRYCNGTLRRPSRNHAPSSRRGCSAPPAWRCASPAGWSSPAAGADRGAGRRPPRHSSRPGSRSARRPRGRRSTRNRAGRSPRSGGGASSSPPRTLRGSPPFLPAPSTDRDPGAPRSARSAARSSCECRRSAGARRRPTYS